MSLSGVVKNGRVEFTEASDLADGTEVLVDVLRPREDDGETREEYLQSLRKSIESGLDDCVPAKLFLEQWRREIEERERTAEGGQ